MGLVKALFPALCLLAACVDPDADEQPEPIETGLSETDGDVTEGGGDDEGTMPGPLPDGSPMVLCEDGVVSLGAWTWFTQTPHGQAPEVARCATGTCQAASAICGVDCDAAIATVCNADPAGVPTSILEGDACTEATESPLVTPCGFAVPGSDCTCADGSYACTEATPVAATHAAIVGKWRGYVSTLFREPYEVSLWIYPDGSYWAETYLGYGYPSDGAFYYGLNGPHPDLRFQLLSVDAEAGAYGHVAQWPDHPGGQVAGLVVSDTRLTFTFNASWHNCAQPIEFDLTRED